jgi:hypothetical protein
VIPSAAAVLLLLLLCVAVERLDNEQTRVQGLEDIVGQLEARLEELSQLALSAPSTGVGWASGLEFMFSCG